MILQKSDLPGDTRSIRKMDDAHKKLETGLESIYDRDRRPFERLYLNWAVTQNGLQSLKMAYKTLCGLTSYGRIMSKVRVLVAVQL